MDDLAELERFVQTLDEFERRRAALEDQRPAPRFTLADGVAQSRAVVVQLRESGLSLSQIAAAAGSAVATIGRDLQATRIARRRALGSLHGAVAPECASDQENCSSGLKSLFSVTLLARHASLTEDRR